MAQITSATLEAPIIVVIDTPFQITVTFDQEDINPNSLEYTDFSGDFQVDPKSKVIVTADTVFTFMAKATKASVGSKIMLNLAGIEDDATETLGTGTVESESIEVIDMPDFQIFASTTKTFDLKKFFSNPIDTALTITGTDDWTAPDNSNVAFEGTGIKVDSPTQGDGATDFLSDGESFRDVIIQAKADNGAGEALYNYVVRINSAKPVALPRGEC